MRIEPWQVPVLVTAGMVALAFPVQAIAERVSRKGPAARLATTRVRTLALVLLAALILVIFVWAVGTSMADWLATVASAVTGALALWLAFISYQDQRKRAEPSAAAAEKVEEAPKAPPES